MEPATFWGKAALDSGHSPHLLGQPSLVMEDYREKEGDAGGPSHLWTSSLAPC